LLRLADIADEDEDAELTLLPEETVPVPVRFVLAGPPVFDEVDLPCVPDEVLSMLELLKPVPDIPAVPIYIQKK